MVSVEHIEHLINEHARIAESAIVAYRPPEKEELKEDEIVAHIVLKKGGQLSAPDFYERSEKDLARFMRPRYVVLVDSFPKTPTERIQRFRLREEGLKRVVKLY